MNLPTEKLEEIEYYERDLIQGHNRKGQPYAKDVFTFHYGETEREWKLFGKWVIWSKTVPDRKETLTFERKRVPDGRDEEGTQKYKLAVTDSVMRLSKQLKAYFDSEFLEVYNSLAEHEVDYMTS